MRFLLCNAVVLTSLAASASSLNLSDPANLPPPGGDAPGFPKADPNLDVLPGFVAPPPGYGEVPFWWWTGDPLDKERLGEQLDQLHAKGLSGVQINYAHDPTMLTYAVEPPIFSEAWWEIWRWIVEECHKRGMGIGLSGYTIDWPNHDNLFRKIGVNDGSLPGISLAVKEQKASGGAFSWTLPKDTIALMAYPVSGDAIAVEKALDLRPRIQGDAVHAELPAGDWKVVAVTGSPKEYTLDPMDPNSGKRVIERFFEPFAAHSPGDLAQAMNYFFQDELNFGVDGWLWTARFPEEFQKRKGYDILPWLPALFMDLGPKTPKIRLDFSDVMISLSEEYYFKPIFDWHWSRGMIYACDPGSRGKDPLEFGDYFRCVRWYTAPGHDTPGGKADLIKDKVSSSIAHLYHRPRVWLEGYHSLGWGATPATIFDSTCKNFLYGANLLNLHGLYYTTHGSYWEWAPPCYHFRMPYWDHMEGFLDYFERLSYLLSQGSHVCDVAIMYPVAPLEAGMDGEAAVDTAFGAGTALFMNHGIDFDFMDFESLERAAVQDRQLQVSGEAYRVLILPAMRAVRQSTLDKALAFYRAGGMVLALGTLPEASDRQGYGDAALDAEVREIFGLTAAEAKAGKSATPQRNAAGGIGCLLPGAAEAAQQITGAITRDFLPGEGGQVLHRRIGSRDVYMIMGAAKGSSCFFRASGAASLWNPWTGETTPLSILSKEKEGVRLATAGAADLAQIIVFDRNETPVIDAAPASPEAPAEQIAVAGAWEFELKPTLDNRHGDFRLPVRDAIIGAEARRFRYAEETDANPGWEKADTDDASWARKTSAFGVQFWKIGPVADSADAASLEKALAALTRVDTRTPPVIGETAYAWQPYEYSARWGVEGDPGPQGHHGLKEMISNDFIVLGKADYNGISIDYLPEIEKGRYYLWTTVSAPADLDAYMFAGAIKPAALWIDGKKIDDLSKPVSLKAGFNPVLLRYDGPGRTHFIFSKNPVVQETSATPLAMRWYGDPGVLSCNARPETAQPVGWYRFLSPPGLKAMRIDVIGKLEAWADGVALKTGPGVVLPGGVTEYTVSIPTPNPAAVSVALRIAQEPGVYGGAAIPEPIALDCGPGRMEAGDWAQRGVLADYSGGAWYRNTFSLTKEQAGNKVLLNLGEVVATAAIRINGKEAGLLVTPPWTLDISKEVAAGENRIEILVYNTLANHYGTIPTHYRGENKSGLIGPVSVDIYPAEKK